MSSNYSELKLGRKEFGTTIIFDETFSDVILRKYFYIKYSRKYDLLELDFSEISRINIDVLVQLLALGYIAKRDNIRLKIKFNVETDLIKFLIKSEFMKINRIYNFFEIDDYVDDIDVSNYETSTIFKAYDKVLLDKKYQYINYILSLSEKIEDKETEDKVEDKNTDSKKEKSRDNDEMSDENYSEEEKRKIYRYLELEIVGSLVMNNQNTVHPILRKDFDLLEKEKNPDRKPTIFAKVLANIACPEEQSIETPDIVEHNRKSDKKYTRKDYVSYNKVFQLANPIIELIHNSLFHGRKLCFVCLQSYRNKKGDTVEIAVKDVGEGLYKSLLKKINKTFTVSFSEFIGYNDEEGFSNEIRKNYYSIFEALMYRRKVGMRGLYDICEDISNIGKYDSFIEIKNMNTKLKLYKDKIIKYILVRGSNFEANNKNKKVDEINNEEIKKKLSLLLNEIKKANKNIDFEHREPYNKLYIEGVSSYIKIIKD